MTPRLKYAKSALRHCCRLVGRRNLYRVSRFLMHAARGDVPNDPGSNGEQMVQGHALHACQAPAIVFDIGANVGNWTASLLGLAAGMKIPVDVHAFEPCRSTFQRLSERARQWPSIRLNQLACSRQPGTAKMHVFGDGFGINSLVDPVEDWVSQSEEVQLTTIDLYCKDQAVHAIDLLKVDAEGHDFDVLVGATNMLENGAIRLIQFEYNQRWIGARNYLRDVFEFLTPKGFVIGKLSGSQVEIYSKWQWELENYVEGNYIACSEPESRQFRRGLPSWLPALGGISARLPAPAQPERN